MQSPIFAGFTKVQRWTRRFTFNLSFSFELSHGAVSALTFGHTVHNVGVIKAVLIQVLLQVRVEVPQFAAVKHLVGADLFALFMLLVLHNWDEAKVQMRLSAL